MVVLQESIPAQFRQLILRISNNKGQVDRFVRELTFSTRLCKQYYTRIIAHLKDIVYVDYRLVEPEKVVRNPIPRPPMT